MVTPTKLHNRSDITGTTDLFTSYGRYDSGPRLHMAAAQSQQALMPLRPDIPISLTGFEPQMSDYTMAIKMPCDAYIVDVISKYIPSNVKGGVKGNNITTIVYQDSDTGAYGSIDLEGYYRAHDIFGMEYVRTQACNSLRPGQGIPKGTVLAHSIGAKKEGVYTSSLTMNVANIAMPGIIEDGLIILDEALERARPIAMAKRDAEWGKTRYPISIYGEGQPFPGPGEKLRDDNLIFCTRKYDPLLDCVNMLPEMLTRPNRAHDECVYAPPDCKDAKVVDAKVVCSSTGNRLRQTPPTMETYTNMFVKQTSAYYDKLVDRYNNLARENGRTMSITPQFEELLTVAMSDRPNDAGRTRRGRQNTGTVQKTYKAKPIDEWHVEIEFAWRYDLRYGAKLSDFHGCKGVVCEIRSREHMPKDEFGNVCDVIQFGGSPIARMNIGQEYERYINAAARDVSKDCRRIMESTGAWQEAWQHAMNFIAIVSPKQHAHFLKVKNTPQKQQAYVHNICNDIIRLYVAPDTEVGGKELIKAIRAYRRPDKGPLTYTNYDGRKVTTRKDILIGPKQMIVLDKSSFKPMAVSVGQRQNHGLLATTNKRTKVAHPVNRQPPRSWGESEIRNLCASMGGYAVAKIVDISTNPEATRCVLRSGFMAEHPLMVHEHFTREEVPAGQGRTIQFVKNLIGCIGIEICDSIDPSLYQTQE